MWRYAFVLVDVTHCCKSRNNREFYRRVWRVCVLRSCVCITMPSCTYTVKMLINYVPWIILRGHPPQLLRYSAHFSSVSSLLFFVSFWFPYMVLCGHWHKSTHPCPYNSLARSKVTSPYFLALLWYPLKCTFEISPLERCWVTCRRALRGARSIRLSSCLSLCWLWELPRDPITHSCLIVCSMRTGRMPTFDEYAYS